MDTVLRGLREAGPAPGLDARVIAALRAAPVAAPARSFGWMWMPAVGVAVVAVVAVVMGVRRHTPATVVSHAGGGQVVLQRAVPAPLAAGSSKRRAMVRQATEAPVAKPVEEASFPPPPLPLTRQERLLLRLAHADDPEDLATLAPEARRAAQEQEKAEVRAFFAPPPMLSEPLPEITGGNP